MLVLYMSYNINIIEGITTNAWTYWVNNPPTGNILSLSSTLNFDKDYGKIILSTGSSFNGNGYSFNFTNIKSTGIQLFELQGGTTSNISIGTSSGTNGILLINTLNNNTSTLINGNLLVNGNISITNQLIGNIINGNTIIGNITSNNIVFNDANLQNTLNNKMDNSTINIMFRIRGI